MRPRLAISAFVLVAGLAGTAAADKDVIVVGPAAAGKLKGAASRHVVKALAEMPVAPVSDRKIEPACATDLACLLRLGAELGSKRVVAITIDKESRNKLELRFVLVDVGENVVLARREVTIADRKLDRELGPALKKFIDDAPVERAKTLFAKGNQHYNLGEFAAALDVYKQAYKTKPLAAFLFNIAQCHRKLGQYQDAVNMYQSYLAGVPDAQNKALVESLITESKDKIADAQRRAQEASTEEARREAERLATEKAKAEEARKAKEAEAVAAAEQRKAEVARLEDERLRRGEREKLYDRHPARKFAYVGAALGAGAVIAGGYFGFKARKAQGSYDDAGCGDPTQILDQQELAQCRDDRDTGKKNATLSNVLMGAGGAVLVASALVFILDPGNLERPREARAQLHLSPTSFKVVVRW